MNKTARYLLAILAVFIVAGSAVPAMAAAPAQWQAISVTLHADEQPAKLLVSGELPPGAELPYAAELAVPAGMQIQWVGEILGGAASADPAMTYVKTSTTNGMDVYRFTLTKSRTAQFEGVVQGMSGLDGANQTAALKWTALQAVPKVSLTTRVLQGAQIVQAAPDATIQAGEGGYSYYTKTVQNAKAGQVLDMTFSYAVPAGSGPAAGSVAASPSNTPAIMMILVLFAGGFVLMIIAVRHKLAAKEAVRVEVQPRRSKAATSHAPAVAPSRRNTKVRAEAPRPPAKKVSFLIPTIAVLGVFVVGAVAVAVASTGTPTVDGKITKNFGAASPCTSASIPVTANQGVDLSSQGSQLLDAFKSEKNIGVVTVDIARSVVDITFCASSQSEESVRQILSGTGLVTVGAAPIAAAPASAAVSTSGKKQTAKVDTSGDRFSPSQVTLKAGVPAEIEFAQAAGCISSVVFSQLGLTQDLTAGAAIVKVPALEPGTYDFACGMGHQKGQLVVQAGK